MTIAHVPPRTWDTRGKALVCSNAFISVGNNGIHAIFPAKALDMSILVSVKNVQKQETEKKQKKNELSPGTFQSFCISGLDLFYQHISFTDFHVLSHRGGIAMTTIDLALMRERNPVTFCDWGKALCCQHTRWT